jgi:hypothetical protein
LFDVLKAAPIARNGYHQYTHIEKIWNMPMPINPDDHVSGGVFGGDFSKTGEAEKGIGGNLEKAKHQQVEGTAPEGEPEKVKLKRVVSSTSVFPQ